MKEIRTTQQRLAVLGRPYILKADGSLKADPAWESANLATVLMPTALPLSWEPSVRTQKVRCHRLVAAQLRGVFKDLKDRDLWGQFQTYGGSYVVRRVRSANGISGHAFGAAFDYDSERMPLRSRARWPRLVVAVWNAHGAICGQDFSRPDPMHFEFVKCYG